MQTSNSKGEPAGTASLNGLKLFLSLPHTKGKILAKAIRNSNSFTVLQGSFAVLKAKSSIYRNDDVSRDELIGLGIMKPENGYFVFTKNYDFFNPSSAAGVICGTRRNGMKDWKNESGRSLGEIEAHVEIGAINISEPERQVLYLSSSFGISAKAYLSNKEVIVLKNSFAAGYKNRCISDSDQKTRGTLIKEGVLVDHGGRFVFSRDCVFKSLNQAANVVLGSHVSGKKYWKDKWGKTFKEIEISEQNKKRSSRIHSGG